MAGCFPKLRIESHEPAPRLDSIMDSRACEEIAVPKSKDPRFNPERPFDIRAVASTIRDYAF